MATNNSVSRHRVTKENLPFLNGRALEAITNAEKVVTALGAQHPNAEAATSAAKKAVAAYLDAKVALNPEDCALPTQPEESEQLHNIEDWTVEFDDDGNASIHLA